MQSLSPDDAALEADHELSQLMDLPTQLTTVSENEVLRVTALKIAQVFPAIQYIRMLLVAQNYQPSELFELCSDMQLSAAMAALPAEASTSQDAAMRRGVPLHTAQLSDKSGGYADWQLLRERFGMQSCAAVPLMVAGTVHGMILAASAQPLCFTPKSMPLLETAAHMLAPYAAVLYKYQQMQVMRGLLQQLLPPRVVNATLDRLGRGVSVVQLFVQSHQAQQHN